MAVPVMPDVQQSVPREKTAREQLRCAVARYAAAGELVPPLSLEELRAHTASVLAAGRWGAEVADFVTVLLANEAWRDVVSAVPYSRRILLLPQCLRSKEECSAEVDELGLVCGRCGRCPVGELEAQAEGLGYAVLIAEGTTVVTKLLEQGRVDAVIGVSCLPAMSRSFPNMAAWAIPGIGIPLYIDGCENTRVDEDWVREAIRARNEGVRHGRPDLEGMRREVCSWFGMGPVRGVLGSDGTKTEELALAWLCRGGSRWRPLLSVGVFRALAGAAGAVPLTVKKVAVAVECFHKASLVHDDIEDGDECRYGKPTLHREYGVPIALNVGDLLLGEGYRLIAGCGAGDARTRQMFSVAAEGHRSLSLGQGEELSWRRERFRPSSREVLEIFRRKTAPAFEVALRLGMICAGGDEELDGALKTFGDSLGIAYQIRDDIKDHSAGSEPGDAEMSRPSLLVALACEASRGSQRDAMDRLWRVGQEGEDVAAGVRDLIGELGVAERARELMEEYRTRAIRALVPLKCGELKGLLRRVLMSILGRV